MKISGTAALKATPQQVWDAFHDPEVLVLDEPTFGQDANTWAELASFLSELLDEGRTAQFNTLFLDPYLWKLQVGGQRRNLATARPRGG